MELHQRAKSSALLTLVNLSIWRLAAPLLGGTFWNLHGLAIGLVISIYFHFIVRDYMGFRLIKVKPLSNIEEFVPFRKWMVPKGDSPLSASGYSAIESDATEYAKKYLAGFPELTNFDFANAYLLDEQYGHTRLRENERLTAARQFYDNNK